MLIFSTSLLKFKYAICANKKKFSHSRIHKLNLILSEKKASERAIGDGVGRKVSEIVFFRFSTSGRNICNV